MDFVEVVAGPKVSPKIAAAPQKDAIWGMFFCFSLVCRLLQEEGRGTKTLGRWAFPRGTSPPLFFSVHPPQLLEDEEFHGVPCTMELM